MKKGFTLIEVIVSIAILLGIILMMFQLQLQMVNFKQSIEQKLKATLLIEALHAQFLNDVSYYNHLDQTIFFDNSLNETTADNYHYEVHYELSTEDGLIYELRLITIYGREDIVLYENVYLGKWRMKND